MSAFSTLVNGLGVEGESPAPAYRSGREQRIHELAAAYVASPARFQIDTAMWAFEKDPGRVLAMLFRLDRAAYRAAVELVAYEDCTAQKKPTRPDVSTRYVQTSPRFLSLQCLALAAYSPAPS